MHEYWAFGLEVEMLIILLALIGWISLFNESLNRLSTKVVIPTSQPCHECHDVMDTDAASTKGAVALFD